MDDHEWPVSESRSEYDTGWYTGGFDRVEQPNGTTKDYYWADLPPAVVVIAVDDGDVVFVSQYRPVIREQCLELVAGIVEQSETTTDERTPAPGRESYVAAGRRELREETGYAAQRVAFVQESWVATGVLRHRRGIVFAAGLTRTGRDLDDNEFLSVERVPVEDALAVARKQPANDATIEGVLLARADGHL